MGDQPTSRDRTTPRAVAPGVVIGSALEWFDFYLYASMAALVFGRVFFPSVDGAAGTLASFATFAVGFLARPIGGVVFGHLGDRIGRKATMSLTFSVMGVSTGLIGLLPSYDAIGIAAPILLVVFRILQGAGAGAEWTTATVLAYEHAKAGRKGRAGSLSALGVNIGLLASSLCVAALTSMDQAALDSWGWRIPFLASFVLLGLGIYVRSRVPETPEFEKVEHVTQRRSTVEALRAMLRSDWRGVAVVLVVTLGYNGATYTYKTFSLTYLQEFRDVPASIGAFGVTLASAAAIVAVPIAGRLCDLVDAKWIILGGGAGMVAMAFPFFTLLDTGANGYIWLALILTTGLIMPFTLAACGSFWSRQIAPDVRSLGFAVGREFGGAFAGGLVPLLALTLVTVSDTSSTWGVSLLFVLCGVFVVGGVAMDQTRQVRERAVAEPVAGRT
ncbi:putative MFS family arabinose efflux permease [Pseudonocardia sediminis]|uniref:Putative proline/betaine transporter n=1 Tax=Pseudonocardia sediminis TaxID=1397368 RepID=A0A4Q7V3M5_PSEST|nr:MFS transporter [Pseudonocardia sediminis]RZT89006.1 putative MFS family arabinose efflux permease [Pseudonocardia sediminis]